MVEALGVDVYEKPALPGFEAEEDLQIKPETFTAPDQKEELKSVFFPKGTAIWPWDKGKYRPSRFGYVVNPVGIKAIRLEDQKIAGYQAYESLEEIHLYRLSTDLARKGSAGFWDLPPGTKFGTKTSNERSLKSK